MSSSVNIVNAADSNTNSATTKDWGNSLITKVQLQDSTGTVKDKFGQYDDMIAYWEFSSKKDGQNEVLHSGDTMIVNVPSELSLKNGAKDKPIYETGTGNKIGDGTLDKDTRKITIVFNDYAANKSKTSPVVGSFQVSVNWDTNFISKEQNVDLSWITQGSSSTDTGSTGSVVVTPSIPNPDEILYKYGGLDNDIIKWTVRVNYKGDSIPNATYLDTIGKNQTLLTDADHPITINSATSNHTTGQVIEDSVNKLADKIAIKTDTGFKVELGDINQTVLINYCTHIDNADNLSTSYSNTGDLLSNKREISNVPVNIATNQFNSVAGTGDEITSLMGHKIWNVPVGTNHPDEVTINLLQNGNPYSTQIASVDNDWSYVFNNLPKFDNEGNPYKYTVSENSVYGFTSQPSTAYGNYDITNILTPDKTKYTITKVWNDGKEQNNHAPITIGIFDGNNLRPTGYPDDIHLSKDNNWTYTFTGLAKDTIWYTSEINASKKYIATDSYNYGNSYDKTITNTLATNLNVTKKWDDNNYASRPTEIQVQLYANDNNQGAKALGTPETLNNDNNWSYTFGADDPNNTANATNQLPKYDSDNKEITYTAKEVSVPDGYNNPTISYNNDKTEETITNTRDSTTPTDDTRNFTVTKKWADNNNDTGKRPTSIKIQLFANGEPSGDPITITGDKASDDNWTHTWNDLAKQADGKDITYSVQEIDPDNNYAVNIDKADTNDTIITNTLKSTTPPTDNNTDFTVTKKWNDENDKDKIRPTSVNVQLLDSDNNVIQKATLDETNNWTTTWKDLDSKLTYHVQEDSVSGYTPSQSGNGNNITITNTHTPTTTTPPTDDKTSLNVTKVWSDSNNKDQIRPGQVKVQLLADGKVQGDPIILNAGNNWSHEFTNLDKNVNYSVQEEPVPGYATNIDKIDGNNITITNTHTPKTTTPPADDKTYLNVSKVWSDSNNKDQIRPGQVKVQLLADDKAQGDPIILNSDNNWSHEFTNLDKNVNYSVQEEPVPGYATNIDKIDSNNITITNTHTPKTTTPPTDKTQLTVNKVWNDNNNQDQLRPNNVTVHLYANGSVIGDPITLNNDNNWTYTWNNLDKDTQYTVQEDTVSSYTASENTTDNNVTITNTHITTPGNPGGSYVPGVPGGNNGGSGGNGGGNPGTSTGFNPGNPSSYQPGTSYDRLPQTGTKDANLAYMLVGFMLLGLVPTYIIRKRRI
ncbi:Collagen adhesin [Companilactobacillus kimchiensis]|uniref:Collagen adhesin n=2 Tax=Companilactobacillus kimchiensis TaxID=993692 RepID=A0A0R2L8E5_9LACO|nr:Collagen adhesin [Companilactobacillus kimchiensis]